MISQSVVRNLLCMRALSSAQMSVFAGPSLPMRHFVAKKRKGRKKREDGGLQTTEEDGEETASEAVAEPVPTPAAPTSGNFFSVGDIKVLNSTPDHKPPS